MKNRIAITLLPGLLALTSTILAAEGIGSDSYQRQKAVFQERLTQLAEEPIDADLLEPCINGQVSASGLYVTQADEDSALAGAMALDPGMSGRFATSTH